VAGGVDLASYDLPGHRQGQRSELGAHFVHGPLLGQRDLGLGGAQQSVVLLLTTLLGLAAAPSAVLLAWVTISRALCRASSRIS